MKEWGKTKDGKKVQLFELDNGNGLKMEVSNYGATVTRLFAPDLHGNQADVVLGFDNLKDYETKSPYFGVPVGRFGNRIANGKFTLDGKEYKVTINDENAGEKGHLHGGTKGFDKVVWEAETRDTDEGPAIVFTHISPDGDEGYPGDLTVTLTYTLTNYNAFRVEFEAFTTKPTPVNMCQHSYFNLAGHDQGDILDHRLTLIANKTTPVAADMIPTGEILSVAKTPLDFRRAKRIGRDIEKEFEQLKFAGGFDHNWVLKKNPEVFCLAARLLDPKSGRTLEVFTDQPGIQFYSGNFLDGTLKGKGGVVYPKRGGLCLETQHFPDSPNHPNFPSTILHPGEKYETVTEYVFGVEM